jgi:hypothetical protein
MSAGDSQPSRACSQKQFIDSLDSVAATTASKTQKQSIKKVTLEAFSY